MVTGRKLLLADDSVTIQKVIDLTFTDEGLEVITVSDGQQALDMLEDDVPDIVLADVFMPRINGYQLCEHIKRSERFRHIPVMLLVGSFEPFDEAEARRVGADDYLTKPFQSIRTLIGKVGNLLSGGTADSNEATTRKLAPPPGAEKENRAESGFLERSTADTAPLPDAHEETAGASPARDVSFADLSMDDELIETTPVSDYASVGLNTQSRSTVQYTASDLKESGIAQAVESAPPAVLEPLGAYTAAPDSARLAAGGEVRTATRSSEFPLSEDSLLDLGEMETPAAMAEADDFFLDLLEDSPRQSPMSSSGWIEVSNQSTEREVEPSFGRENPVPAPPAHEFVEARIEQEELHTEFTAVEFEAPAANEFSGSQQEYSTVDQAATQRLPDDYHAEQPAADQSSATRGLITLDQISPEVMDAIIRRAVEQLSERVVEQIAWEVVPDLAELLIKRRLEEEKKQ